MVELKKIRRIIKKTSPVKVWNNFQIAKEIEDSIGTCIENLTSRFKTDIIIHTLANWPLWPDL